MKALFLLTLCLVTNFAYAETQFVFGMATYHLAGTTPDDAKHFRNKWSRDGRLIGTPVIAIERFDLSDDSTYKSRKYFAGENSLGGPMLGFVYSSGFVTGNWRLGTVIGLYGQDVSKFHEKGAYAVGVPINKYYHLTPIAGGELIYGSAIKLHLVITPALALSYLSFTF